MEEYKQDFVVSHIDGRDDSVEFLNGIKIYAGDIIGKVSEDQLRRIQIRETILSRRFDFEIMRKAGYGWNGQMENTLPLGKSEE